MAKSQSKEKTVFFCTSCGNESGKWFGRCPSCGEFNTCSEEKVRESQKGTKRIEKLSEESAPVPLSKVISDRDERIESHIKEFDRVLGGGIVKGSLVLLGGDPGIGKSTILLEVARNLSNDGLRLLYVSGEESLSQIKMRAKRVGDFSDSLLLMAETDLFVIEEAIEKTGPQLVIIDSIQTMFSPDVEAAPGSVSQVRESTSILMRLAKSKGITIFVIGHVTKEGNVAGPRVLEHMVDTVLYLEGDRYASYRILRGVKNRFGSTNEIGVFEMTGSGLSEVSDPSGYMLSGRPEGASGSVVAVSMEGTRPILIEIQALVTRSNFGMPRRTAVGIDINRVNLLMAVLEKRIGLKLSEYDAYVNITGGMRMNEPAVDLGIVMAIVSSYKDKPIDDHLFCFGEVGLSGEVRAVSQADQRIAEARKLGFDKCILPKAALSKLSKESMTGIKPYGVSFVSDVVKLF